MKLDPKIVAHPTPNDDDFDKLESKLLVPEDAFISYSFSKKMVYRRIFSEIFLNISVLQFDPTPNLFATPFLLES